MNNNNNKNDFLKQLWYLLKPFAVPFWFWGEAWFLLSPSLLVDASNVGLFADESNGTGAAWSVAGFAVSVLVSTTNSL